VNLSEALFLHTAALPDIPQSEFEQRFRVQWPAEALFAEAFNHPMEFRKRVLAFSQAKQRDARRESKLSKRASDAVRMVLDGKGFLHSPRTIYIENASPDLLGAQIQEMELGLKEATPEQRQHGVADMRGQHRLFRGVAGSGKSILLALSAAQTLGRLALQTGDLFADAQGTDERKRVLVVCFNRTLVHYLRQRIDDRYGRLTWDKPSSKMLSVVHFERLIKLIEDRDPRLATGLTFEQKEERARTLCQRLDALDDRARHDLAYDAVYVDEAQDLLPDEISLLLRLARRDDKGQQTFIVFYDNAQNIYGVTPPVWEKLGVNIVGGRTVFLDKCLRNTVQTLSIAFNVLVGSYAPEGERVTTRTFADVGSLRQRGLVEETDGRFELRFAPRQGPFPFVRCYPSRRAEVEGVAEEVRRLVTEQRVVPSDILVLYKTHFAYQNDLIPALERAVGDAHKVRQVRSDDTESKSRPLIEDGTLTVSTIASAKGYDAPVVFLLGADDLATDTKGRASFYVGATRAKLLLTVTGVQRQTPTLLDEVAAAARSLGPADHVVGG
jgi:superfamily I DNA and RNA helicase